MKKEKKRRRDKGKFLEEVLFDSAQGGGKLGEKYMVPLVIAKSKKIGVKSVYGIFN